jgi:alpha-tubulin suppressor-like RCC1 family protein
MLGCTSGVPDVTSPRSYPNLSVSWVSQHLARVCIVTQSGAVRCWGGGTSVSGATDGPDLMQGAQIVSVANSHICAVSATGGVRCSSAWTTEPIPENDELTDVKAIGTGNYCTCALTVSGGVRCWGSNVECGLVSDGRSQQYGFKPKYDLLSGVRGIAVGYDHACAVMTTGGVRCWGNNDAGQLGNGTTVNYVSQDWGPTPIQIAL